MPISAAGSPERRRGGGYTLIELLVVVAILALATLGVVLSQRNGTEIQLQREAERLSALLEAARAHSQFSGVPVRWRPSPQGFRFDGLDNEKWPGQWLDSDTLVSPEAVLLLGPEPVIGPQSLELGTRRDPQFRLRLTTDGLRPFVVQPSRATP
ncbi:MAG: type II secretion system protein GspH [Rhodoferax sp.]|nr:type II secretion system protein GspH [Rhodoferax sp.]